MNKAAQLLMQDIPDIIIGYGDSDEFSFILHKNCNLFDRRESKLISTFSSTITAYYIKLWNEFFINENEKLEINKLPTFDARAVLYPTIQNLKDYLSWRQADCHINNLYNTTFWTLVLKGNLTPKEAENRLIGTLSSDKNEILFTEFGINYNNEPDIFKKGTVIIRDYSESNKNENLNDDSELSNRQKQRRDKKRRKAQIKVEHVDIINEEFWNKRDWLLK